MGVDLTPTLLDLLGLPLDPSLPGVSLADALLHGGAASRSGAAFSRTEYQDADKVAILEQTGEGVFHLIRDDVLRQGGDARLELYSLDDALEMDDVSDEHQELVLSMAAELRRWERRVRMDAAHAGPAEEIRPDREVLDGLRALGYLE